MAVLSATLQGMMLENANMRREIRILQKQSSKLEESMRVNDESIANLRQENDDHDQAAKLLGQVAEVCRHVLDVDVDQASNAEVT